MKIRQSAFGENYIRVVSYNPFKKRFLFIDTLEYLADKLFIEHKIKVKFGAEWGKRGTPYIFIFCSIKSKDEKEFLSALSELNNKMILRGHTDYKEFCDNILTKFKNGELPN